MLPGAAPNPLWMNAPYDGCGLSARWQLLQRPVVRFMTSDAAAGKLAWNRAWAHSFPATPDAVETPAWLWQKLQSWLVTLMSSWLICAGVAAATPVAALADVSIVDGVRPTGKLLRVPATPPPPLARPWHSWQVRAPGAAACSEIDRLQAPTVFCASAAWQAAQSLP